MNFRDGVNKGHIRCENCQFFSYVSVGEGHCRINPPITVDIECDRKWPKVETHDWCGQWENYPNVKN